MKTRITLLICFFIIILFSACAPATPLATQTPTPQPTVTVTPTITPSPAPTATATIEVDPYTIDMEKFLNPAPSYEYMVEHPEEYQQAPDLLSDVEAFKDWYYNQYVPALLAGHEEKMHDMDGNAFSKRNVTNFTASSGMYPAGGYGLDMVISSSDLSLTPLQGELPIAYFMHEGIMYPILAFTVSDRGNSGIGTYSVILDPKSQSPFSDGSDAIKNLYDGNMIKLIQLEKEISEEYTPNPEIVQKFLYDGFNWRVDLLKVGPFFNIGIGLIQTIKK